MNIKATCNCGATLEIDATSEAYAAKVFQDFLAAHPECNHNASRPTADPITPGKNAELGETHKLRKELCNHILAELAGHRFPTPEETYGADIGWAVADMSKALAEAVKHAKVQPAGWRIPKSGDKVRLVKQPNPTLYGFDWLKVGDVVEAECVTGCCTGEPKPEGADVWRHTSTAGILFKKPNSEPHETAALPLDCIEPVNETTTKEAK